MPDYYRVITVKGKLYLRPHIRFRQGTWQVFRSYVAPKNGVFPQACGDSPVEAYKAFCRYEYQ